MKKFAQKRTNCSQVQGGAKIIFCVGTLFEPQGTYFRLFVKNYDSSVENADSPHPLPTMTPVLDPPLDSDKLLAQRTAPVAANRVKLPVLPVPVDSLL